jgi:UDP-N-acetylglucosamine 4-epimerase
MEQNGGRWTALRRQLEHEPRRWVVTGAAGFIGSNLVETLLSLGQEVVGLDNFSTGHPRNLDEAQDAAGDAGGSFRFIEGDVRDLEACRAACDGADYVLHQAALGSVPRSLADPITSHASNVDGFVNMLVAARDAGVRRFVFASSSSVYGDHPDLPKREALTGRPLSPYAVTKAVNELYAAVFQRSYGMETIGLRYFNVFGPRQDPEGPYAAVIPRWVAALLRCEPCEIFGDGETSRDFCYVANAVQANLLAATAPSESSDAVYNVACGGRTTLRELYAALRRGLAADLPAGTPEEPVYRPFRPGDVRHSQADVSAAAGKLGYAPTHSVAQGLAEALPWYLRTAREAGVAAA